MHPQATDIYNDIVSQINQLTAGTHCITHIWEPTCMSKIDHIDNSDAVYAAWQSINQRFYEITCQNEIGDDDIAELNGLTECIKALEAQMQLEDNRHWPPTS